VASRQSQLNTRNSKIRNQLAGYIRKTRSEIKSRYGKSFPGTGKTTAAVEKRRYLKWNMSRHLGSGR